MGDPFAICVLIGVEAFALAVGEADKALAGAFFADKAGRQCQQVVDLHREHGAAAGVAADFLADKTSGLPVLRHSGTRQHRDPGKQSEVTGQRQHHALCQRGDRQAQRIAVQPRQPRKVAQMPAHAVGDQRQHQGVKPDKRTGRQPGKNTPAVGLFPVQRAKHCGRQLSDRREGNLPDGGQAGRGAQQAVTDIRQQQDDHDRHAAHREHPVTEHLERALGVFVA